MMAGGVLKLDLGEEFLLFFLTKKYEYFDN